MIPNMPPSARSSSTRGSRRSLKGLLIYNPFVELEEVYDGHAFPEYYYNNSLLSLNAEYGGRTELLQLPDEALAIKKAIDRLGAPSAED